MPKLGISFFVAVALVFFAASQSALDGLGNGLSSLRFAVASRAPTGTIGLVEIDAKSLKAIGTWPWPRSVHAKIVDRLTEAGASEIAFDIDFSARSNETADSLFEAALERAGGGVILAAFNQALSSDDAGEVHANRPLQRFADQGWEGTVNVFADRDGRVRNFPYGQTIGGEIVPSIPSLLGGHSGDETTEFLVDFGIDAFAIDRISVIDLIEGRIAKSRIENRKLIVGAGAAELRDTFAVPYYGIISGPMVQALATETILQDRALFKTGFAFGGVSLAILALLTWVALRRFRNSSVLVSLVVTAVCIEAAAIIVQSQASVIFDTSQLQLGSALFVGIILMRELDYRKLKLFVSNRNAMNVRTILDQVVTDNFDGIVIVDEDFTVKSCSKVACDILEKDYRGQNGGIDTQSGLPREMATRISEVLTLARSADRLEASPVAECEYTPEDASERKILEYVVTPSRLETGGKNDKNLNATYVACLTFRDITDKRVAQDRLAYLAKTDKITGLANRNHFCEKLHDAIVATIDPEPNENDAADDAFATVASGGGIICFNLSRFRYVNDSLGHDIGDLLLQRVAQRVDLLLDEGDVLSRFGSDEFAVLLVGPTSVETAIHKANLIIEAVGAPMRLGRHDIVVSATAGIAMIKSSEDDVEQIIRDADVALLKVKSEGHERIRVFDPKMGAEIRARREIELDLWGGLDRGEFEVYYQPQVLLNTHEINGVEALVRWRHPERGFVSPADFIPIAETTGMIEKLGAFVLQEACNEVVKWPVPLKVAVNLSAIQFQRGDLVATVKDALATSGLPAERLDLEITESLFIRDGGNTESTLNKLLDLDLTFSLDDFGTGYSSLSYIHKFPIHKIKIDQAFVRNLPEDQASLAIVRAVSTLADAMGLITTVEGIETEEQAKLVHLAGCTQGQGYYFGKPQRGSDIHRLLTDSTSLRLPRIAAAS